MYGAVRRRQTHETTHPARTHHRLARATLAFRVGDRQPHRDRSQRGLAYWTHQVALGGK